MPNEIVAYDLVVADMTRDLNAALKPAIDAMRASGMTNEEINLELNRAMFDAFKGLHGFPDSHRP